MTDPDVITEEFRTWLTSHPERVEAALEALEVLDNFSTALGTTQEAAFVDLINLLARATGQDFLKRERKL